MSGRFPQAIFLQCKQLHIIHRHIVFLKSVGRCLSVKKHTQTFLCYFSLLTRCLLLGFLSVLLPSLVVPLFQHFKKCWVLARNWLGMYKDSECIAVLAMECYMQLIIYLSTCFCWEGDILFMSEPFTYGWMLNALYSRALYVSRQAIGRFRTDLHGS